MAEFPPIPKAQTDGLQILADLSDEQFADLLRQLSAIPPVLSQDTFLKAIGPIDGVELSKVHRAVAALLYLSFIIVPYQMPPLPTVVEDICESLRTSMSNSTIDRLLDRMPKAFSAGAVLARAKAVDLQVEHAKTLQAARILTDLRPVFTVGPTPSLSGLMVVHTLKLDYFEDDTHQEVFIALDQHDVALLVRELKRAEAKAEALKNRVIDPLGLVDFGTAALPEGEKSSVE